MKQVALYDTLSVPFLRNRGKCSVRVPEKGKGKIEMQRPASPRIDPTVFWVAAILSAVFVAWGVLFAESLAAVFDAVLFDFLVPNFGWVFILSSFGFLAFSVYLALSRYGRIRLGGDDEQPEFRTVS